MKAVASKKGFGTGGGGGGLNAAVMLDITASRPNPPNITSLLVVGDDAGSVDVYRMYGVGSDRYLSEKDQEGLGEAPEWVAMEIAVDSGATETVIPMDVLPSVQLEPSDASRRGVSYRVANGEEIPNLGKKPMAVVTAEGTMRGRRAQVADVNKPLQAVRSLARAGHMVVFGAGEPGNENDLVNKITGEYFSVKDGGLNYVMGMHIAPQAEAGFTRPVTSP